MSTPPWLAEFQARFGATLRTPLDRTTGTLTARICDYDAGLVADTRADRLAVYNRQYWFRLFDVLQSAYPLTARLMGYWAFNEVAARFLVEHPPRGWDIEEAADAFAEFAVDGAWRESVLIDAAYRDVFRAPPTPAFRPSSEDAPYLATGQLVPSPALRLVTESRALIALRALAGTELPPLLAAPQAWAILRMEETTRAIALEPREAELIALLGQRPVGDALATIEEACAPEERAGLPDRVRAWLARSIEVGFWSGLRRTA